MRPVHRSLRKGDVVGNDAPRDRRIEGRDDAGAVVVGVDGGRGSRAWGAEAPGQIGAGQNQKGDGGDEKAAEDGEVADGVEFLVARGGHGGGDGLNGAEIGLEGGTDEGEGGEVARDAGEGEGEAGLVAVGDGGDGDDVEGVDRGVGGPAEGESRDGAGEGGEIGEDVAAGTGRCREGVGVGGHGAVLVLAREVGVPHGGMLCTSRARASATGHRA